MQATPVDPYRFAPDFERAVLRHLIFDRRFWGLVGEGIEPDAFSTDPAKMLALAVVAIGHETGKSPGSGTPVVQRVVRWRHEGRVTHETVISVGDLVEELEDFSAPDVDVVVNELVPVIRERKNRESIRDAMKIVATRGDLEPVIRNLQKTSRLGVSQRTVGTKLGLDALAAIRDLRRTDRLSTGITELDSELGGGPLRGTASVVMGGAGDGKCHAKGQGILMANGAIKPVEAVEPGDLLAGPGGAVRVVLCTNMGHGPMFDIVPLRGRPWRVNADHVLTLVRSGGARDGDLVDVALHDWMGWSANRKSKYKLVRSGVDEFVGGSAAGELPIRPYLLGLLLGDGCLCNSDVRLTTADPEIERAVGVEAGLLGLRVHIYRKPGTPAKEIALSGIQGMTNPLARRLEGLGLRGCRSGDKFVPLGYRVAERQARLELLAGLIDTDGSANHTAYEFSTISAGLARDVAFIARSLGFAATVSECEKRAQTGATATCWRVGVSGDVTEIPVLVCRKRLRQRDQTKNVLRGGFSVVPAGDEDFWGFSLDGDGRYLLDDFTVTHNSMFLCHVGGSALLSGRNVLVATLELNEEQWQSRLIANLTGIPIDAIADGSMDAEAAARLEDLPPLGTCFVGQFAPEVTRVDDIMSWVAATEEREGISTDVLIVDYADLMGHTKTRDYEGMREIYAGLREKFGVEHGGWLWTASQARRKERSGKGHHKQGADDAADSQHKIRIADLWIVLQMNEEGSEIEYRISKNRGGKRGGSVTLPTELACGRIAPIAELQATDGTFDLF